MRLFILGGTGGTGRQLIAQALERGHRVTTLVRSPQKITRRTPSLTILDGNPLNAKELQSAMAEHEAVISALGPHRPGHSTVATDSAHATLEAMQSAGIRRLIVVSGATLFTDVGWLRPMFSLVHRILSGVDRDRLEGERLVIESSLEWTIARPPYLSNGSRTGAYRVREGGHPPLGLRISRADLAHFLLEAVERSLHIRKIVGVCR